MSDPHATHQMNLLDVTHDAQAGGLPPTSASHPPRKALPKLTTLERMRHEATDEEAAMVAALRAKGYKVIPTFTPAPRRYGTARPNAILKTGVVLDVETTDATPDAKILQLAAVRFVYDAETCEVLEVTSDYEGLEDPGVPISPEATAVHGLTAEQVAGHRLDDARVAEICAGTELLIAHNAEFDAPKLMARFPALLNRVWGCSYKDVPWKEGYGYQTGKLGHLMELHTGQHLEHVAHDAKSDCYATVELLATPNAEGRRPLADLRALALEDKVVLLAANSPFHRKDTIKATNRYRWNDGSKDAKFPVKAWYTETTAQLAEAEKAWLAREVYGVSDPTQTHIIEKKLPATQRFSPAPGGQGAPRPV